MSEQLPTFPQRIASEVARLGGTAQVARACGYSQRQVEYWAKGLHLPRETARVGVLALLEEEAAQPCALDAIAISALKAKMANSPSHDPA